MRSPQRPDDLVLAVGRIDGLEPQLPNALLAAARADRRIRPLAPEERAGPLRVPRAPLVVPDSPRSRGKERVPHRVQRLGRYEDDELAVHPMTFANWNPARDCDSVAPTDQRRRLVSTNTGNTGALGQPRGIGFG